MTPPGTLVEEARAEADAAERELQENPELAKKDVSILNGGQPTAAPGEQGAATAGEEQQAEYVQPEPSEDEIQRGLRVLSELRARAQDFGSERTIESLVSIVDIVPALRRPDEWAKGEEDEYDAAPQIKEICTLLLKGCAAKLTLSPKDVVYLWRNKAKWTQHGVTVRSNTKPLDTRTQFLTKGTVAVVEINFHHWKALNPLQKIFTCYRALRILDKDASVRHADFEGYFDELELFGPRVFREMAQLKAAIDRGADRELPFQISLFDQGDED